MCFSIHTVTSIHRIFLPLPFSRLLVVLFLLFLYLHLILTCGFTVRCFMHYLFDMPCRFLYFKHNHYNIIAVIVIVDCSKKSSSIHVICCGRFEGIHQVLVVFFYFRLFYARTFIFSPNFVSPCVCIERSRGNKLLLFGLL